MDLTTENLNKLIELTTGPGKFEGESPLTPYYWDAAMDGGGEVEYDADNVDYSVFRPTTEELEFFADYWKDARDYYVVFVNEDGFVHGASMTTEGYAKFKKSLENSFIEDGFCDTDY